MKKALLALLAAAALAACEATTAAGPSDTTMEGAAEPGEAGADDLWWSR